MSSNRLAIFVALVLLVALLAGGLARLFALRFDLGDTYRPYSTLRSDPLGTRALYESLDGLGGLAVARHERSLARLPEGQGVTLMMLGLDGSDFVDFAEEDARSLEDFMVSGGRLVLCLAPEAARPRWLAWDDEPTTPSQAKAHLPTAQRREEERARRLRRNPFRDDPTTDTEKREGISLRLRWKAPLDFKPLEWEEDARDPHLHRYRPAQVRRLAALNVPESVQWRSALAFARLDPAWRVIYARGDKPVLIERGYSRGSMVLATDSFMVSNEALRQERHPALLAWLVGPARRVLFDETHLGVRENPGVMSLALKYRLHGVLAVLVLLAGLYIWKSAIPLVPPRQDEPAREDRRAQGGRAQSGRDAFSGLVDLLRRNIARAKILRVCLEEWIRTSGHERKNAKLIAEKLQAIVEDEEDRPSGQPDQAYRTMVQILNRRGGAAGSASGAANTISKQESKHE